MKHIPVRDNPYILAVDAFEVRVARDAIDEFGPRVGSVKFPFILDDLSPVDPTVRSGNTSRLGWLTAKLNDRCPLVKKGAEVPFSGKPRIAAHNLLTTLTNHKLDYLYLTGHFIEPEIRGLVSELTGGLQDRRIRNGMSRFILVAATSELDDESSRLKYGVSLDDRIAEVSDWVVRYGFGGVYCPGAHAEAAAKVFEKANKVCASRDPDLQRRYAVVADGIRQEGDDAMGKLSVCTAVEALKARATHIVVGSTVLQYEDRCEREKSFDDIERSVRAID